VELGITSWKDFAELAAYATSIIAIGGGAFTYFILRAKENRQQDHVYFESCDEGYRQFLALALQHPTLDVGWYKLEGFDQAKLSATEKFQQDILFEMLTSLFQKAHILYLATSSDRRRKQWSGWEKMIKEYCRKKNYRDWWQADYSFVEAEDTRNMDDYDQAFERYMEGVLQDTASEAVTPFRKTAIKA
jgi:hypothetical protein